MKLLYISNDYHVAESFKTACYDLDFLQKTGKIDAVFFGERMGKANIYFSYCGYNFKKDVQYTVYYIEEQDLVKVTFMNNTVIDEKIIEATPTIKSELSGASEILKLDGVKFGLQLYFIAEKSLGNTDEEIIQKLVHREDCTSVIAPRLKRIIGLEENMIKFYGKYDFKIGKKYVIYSVEKNNTLYTFKFFCNENGFIQLPKNDSF